MVSVGTAGARAGTVTGTGVAPTSVGGAMGDVEGAAVGWSVGEGVGVVGWTVGAGVGD